MVDKMSYDEALNHSGWLQKKSSSVFGGFQKRYFYISSENKLIFSDSKGGKNKGLFDLDFAKISSENENSFKLTIGEKEFLFKAETNDEKTKWINAINAVISQEKKSAANGFKSLESAYITTSNRKNFETQSDTTDKELSRKCLEIKGLNIYLDKFPKEHIESRIIYGFLQKRHKSTVEVFQKRWYFLISPRPLIKSIYDTDEAILDENVLPPTISFDTLYYFKAESENDRSDPVGKIELMDCQGIEVKDKEGKLYILIDLNGRKYELVAENTIERKRWLEALKCSSFTANDYKNSISKRPRNVAKLNKLMDNGGADKVKDICEDEKRRIISEFKCENKNSLEELRYNCGKIEKLLFETIDGCLLSFPPCKELLKIYVDILNPQILEEVKNFWNANYKNLNNNELIDLGYLLYNFEEKLSEYGVVDPNFSLNGRELFKIYSKKNFLDMKKELESIMKLERELNILKDEETISTIAPGMIFKYIYSTFEFIKTTRNKQLLEFFLINVKEIILCYILTSDNIITNTSYSLNIEYIISLSNNSCKLNSLIEEIISNVTKENVLQDNEATEFLKKNNLSNWLNILSSNAIVRLVNELYVTIQNAFITQPYISISLDKNIFYIIKETFEKIDKLFLPASKKILWTEIFQTTLFYYILSLLRSGLVNVRDFDELKYKVITDKDLFISFFENYFEKFILTDVLKIFDDIFEILTTPKESLANCCFKLRKMHGRQFTFIIAKSFVNLKMDLTLNNKQVVNLEIKELYEKNPLNETNVQRNNMRLLSMINEHIHEKSDKIEEKESKDLTIRRRSKTLAEYIKDHNSGKNDEKEENELDFVTYTTIKTEKTIVEKEVISGYLKKKSYTVWQEKYFVIKNSFLYWYKSKDSKEHQNYLNLLDCMKVQSYKTNKFMLIIDDKIYKFDCGNEEIKNEWINAIMAEMKKNKGKKERKIENTYQVKLRKKLINDLLKFPNAFSHINEINSYVHDLIPKEPHFFKMKNGTYNESKQKKDKKVSFGLNMDMGFISNEQKSSSIFSCCKNCFNIFKKKKNYNEFEENQK